MSGRYTEALAVSLKTEVPGGKKTALELPLSGGYWGLNCYTTFWKGLGGNATYNKYVLTSRPEKLHFLIQLSTIHLMLIWF